jgi:molybdopterin synthase sulfur carrier subunit
VAILRLFAGAREAAGTAHDEFDSATVGELLAEADERYGNDFVAIRRASRVWLNGDEADDGDPISEGDEVAVLPPVSGGA